MRLEIKLDHDGWNWLKQEEKVVYVVLAHRKNNQ